MLQRIMREEQEDEEPGYYGFNGCGTSNEFNFPEADFWPWK